VAPVVAVRASWLLLLAYRKNVAYRKNGRT
jgi:hypothetical protein